MKTSVRIAMAFFQPWRSLVLLAVAAAAPALFGAAAGREAGRPFVQLFGRADYRGHAQVWCGAADARGLLYFGNYGQVLVYDGGQWDRILVPGATFVRALALDARGRMWAGGPNTVGYIDTNAATPRFTSIADQLPVEARTVGDITRIHVVGDSVYFQSQEWLLRWRGEQLKAWPLAATGVWQSMVIGGDLLVQNPLHGWLRAGAEKLEPAGGGLAFSPPTRFALPQGKSRWLIGTLRVGLFSYDGRGVTRVIADSMPYLRDSFLFNGLQLPDGRYVMSTLKGGAMILAPDLSAEMIIDDATGLPGNAVNQALVDPQGGLWLCLEDGLARIADAGASSWFRPPGPLPRLDGFAFERFEGRLYFGMAREVMQLVPGAVGATARWEVRSQVRGFINTLAEAEHTLFVGDADGVYAMNKDWQPERIAVIDDCYALFASARAPGSLLVGHRGGVTLLRREGQEGAGWKVAAERIGGVVEVGSFVEDDSGAVWAAGSDRVLRLTWPAGAAAPAAEAFDCSQKLRRVALVGGRPLFLTDAGLQRFDTATKRLVPEPAYGARFADGSAPPGALVDDGEGGVWLAPILAGDTKAWSETTLGHATRDGQWTPLFVPDLTRIGDIHGLRLEREGAQQILWVVGVSGILRVNLGLARAAPPPGATLVREATASDRRSLLGQPGDKPLTLAATANSVRFRVAAPGLAGRDGTQFETELRGLGDAEPYLSASPEREFTHLWEGRYVFRARARAAGGAWTMPVELAFEVLPPWWRTPGAYALWAVLAIGVVGGVVALRTRALHRRALALEAVVAERTQELNVRNAELMRLHRLELDEKISARLAEEQARLEVLRYQLNPHFLFNALNSICTQIMQQPAAARAMVVRLADFCRHTLHRPRAEENPTIGEELEHLRAYLDIEKVRLGELLEVEVAAEPGTELVRVPPFLLLPLVENAVKYGTATSHECVRIRLGVRREGDGAILIEVANSGTWVTPGTSGVHSTRIGLNNLRQRLARHFPDAHEFTTEAHDGWVVVRLRLSPPRSREQGARSREAVV